MSLTALTVRGPFRGPSGYEHHVREFVRELHRQGVAVELIDVPGWGPARLAEAQRDPWFDTLGNPIGARTVLQFCMPHQVRRFADRLSVNYTMFEATRIPRHWVKRALEQALVILPTESSRRAWLASGVPAEKLRVCPLGIDPTLFQSRPAALPLRLESGRSVVEHRTRFLNVSELGPRKNLIGLLRAWLLGTTRQDDAVLILKLGSYLPGERERFERELARLQARLGRSLADAAAVCFVFDVFADAEMPRLFASATHYLSLSHGEGWDQSMVEAAASGLRLIAPRHSAYPTYLDPSVAQLIPCREVPATVPADSGLQTFFGGANWWEPDEQAAIDCLRRAIAGQDAPTHSARERVLRDFTWEKATRRLVAILEDLEAPGWGRRFWSRLPWSRRS